MSTVEPASEMTYEAASQEPEYLEVNRGFTRIIPLDHCRQILDMACGAGTVSQMLLEAAPRANLNGIDPDPMQIKLATKQLSKLGYTVRPGLEIARGVANDKPVVALGVGKLDTLPFPDNTFDCVTIANAIHVVDDKDGLIKEAHRVLKKGGLFGFNSDFYSGSYTKGTERHTLIWIKLAAAYIEGQNHQLVAEGNPPIKRVHGTTRKAFQNRWFSPKEWCAKVTPAGFEIRKVNERMVELGAPFLSAVGAYTGLAEVLMSGYPAATASRAMQVTAGDVLREMGLKTLPRNWLEIWAVKV